MINEFIEQLNSADVGAILFLIWCVFRVILAVFEFFTTKNTNKVKKEMIALEKEIKDVANGEKQEVKATRKFQKVFSPYVKEYIYDEKTDSIKETGGFINVDEKIQSHLETCFEKILEKLLPEEQLGQYLPSVLTDDQFGEAPALDDPLMDLAEAKDYFYTMKEKYGLDMDLTDMEVYDELGKLANKADERVKKYQTKKTEPVVENKEPVDDQIDVDEAIAYYKEHHKEA